MKIKKLNKKGQLGLKTAGAFVIGIMILLVIGFLSVVILGSLVDSGDSVLPVNSRNLYNETVVLNVTGQQLSVFALSGRNKECTILIATNYTNKGLTVETANYSEADCIVTATNLDTAYNNTNVNWSYTFQWQDGAGEESLRNGSAGLASFTSNIPTWFSLLSIVILVLIIVIIINAVRGAGGGMAGEGMGGRSGGSMLGNKL